MVKEDYKPIKPAKIGFAQKILLGIAALGLAGTVAYSLIDNYLNYTKVEVYNSSVEALRIDLNKYDYGNHSERRILIRYKECYGKIDKKEQIDAIINRESQDEFKGLILKIDILQPYHKVYYDFDCDDKVDLIEYREDGFKRADKFGIQDKLFEQANEDLAKFKKDLKEHVDLQEEINKKWQVEKNE
ncbi:MAG: hypothetical protein KKA65_04850 [Nanoarchaeota archaeon]|nr:hypothetical protein [Nanoarchaeota archaeon]MBU4456805.1 hypothetical protein [Nanoarchaeota archaeon]MCG2719814.1 hypothetical protein [Nanoarchaeota archaeon]